MESFHYSPPPADERSALTGSPTKLGDRPVGLCLIIRYLLYCQVFFSSTILGDPKYAELTLPALSAVLRVPSRGFLLKYSTNFSDISNIHCLYLKNRKRIFTDIRKFFILFVFFVKQTSKDLCYLCSSVSRKKLHLQLSQFPSRNPEPLNL